MELKNLVTLWILCLCLVGESLAEKPGSSTSDSQVFENAVSGECCVIYFVLCHFLCVTPLSLCCTLGSTFIHLLSLVDAHYRQSVNMWLSMPHLGDFFFQELYVAMLRIVQLAFSIKPCPLSQIRLNAQSSLYNQWIMDCTADFYPVLLCRRWQAWMCTHPHNFSEHK